MPGPALLFDLDGTLLDTDALHRKVFAKMLAPRGLDITEAFYAEHLHGRLNTDFFAEFLPDEPDPQGLSDAKEAAFRAHLPRPYPAMPGAPALIRHARNNGWRLAVVTNANRLNAWAMLEAIGFDDVFETVVIGEECTHGKPHPEPYLRAMLALKAQPEECIAFEDSPSGIRAAAASKAYTVGICSQMSDTQLREQGARATLKDFNDPALGDILARFDNEEST